VVSLFLDRRTLSLHDAFEHWNQQQRRKFYHTHVTHRAAVHELDSKGCFTRSEKLVIERYDRHEET
jgi:hypothetical protein